MKTLIILLVLLICGCNTEHTTFNEGNIDKQITIIESISNESITFGWGCCDYYFEDPEPECEIKPILRPLSDLTKEEYKIELRKMLYKFDNDSIYGIISDIKDGYAEYGLMVFCFDHHFDVFGLLENNLAIDINTLNK